MNSPYSLIPITVLSVTFYLLTYFAARLGIIRMSVHRKFWNILLLICFLFTACIGLFLAIQVNYKIKFSLTDQLLVWHVDFGIGMAMIAIFHFLWHLNYYTALFHFEKKADRNDQIESWKQANTEEVIQINLIQKLPVFALGMTSIITQVVCLREFMSIFEGNELVIGTILGNWMILTGLGSYLARSVVNKSISKNFVFYALIGSGIIPVVNIIFLNYLKNIIFPLGSMIGLFQIFLTSFLLLLPFCILSGFLFTFYAYTLSEKSRSNLISRVYVMESTGSLIAGFIYSFILIYFLRSLQILTFILLINLIIGLFYVGQRIKWIVKIILAIPVAVIFLLTFTDHLDLRIKGFLFPNQEIVFLKDTPQGNLIITESAGQKNFYENNGLLFSTDNVIENEESAHFAMLQHESPEKVLLIGGGISGITKEILKYPVIQIDYVEINPWIIRIGKKYTKSMEDNRIHVFNDDPRLFLRKTKNKYDVVIIDIPAPSSAKLNRFFTLEFFGELKKKTSDQGIISLSLPSTENYISEKAAMLQSVIFHTLNQVFKHVSILPGEKNYFIASDGIPDLKIARLVGEKGLDNVYVNPYYVDDEDLERRSKYILENILPEGKTNKDFQPVAYFIQIGYWMSHFGPGYLIPGITGIIIVIFLLIRMNSINRGLFTTGFTSSSMEMLFIFSFQIICGYIYHLVGIIITIFMAGLAVGALYQVKLTKYDKMEYYWKIQFIIAIYSCLLPGLIISLQILHITTYLVYLVFIIITFIIAVISGFQFSLASRLQQRSIAEVSAGIYSIDLLGSAIGILLVSVYLLPLLGFFKVFILLAVLNILSGLINMFKTMGNKIRFT